MSNKIEATFHGCSDVEHAALIERVAELTIERDVARDEAAQESKHCEALCKRVEETERAWSGQLVEKEEAQAEVRDLRAKVEGLAAIAKRLGCADRHDDAGEMVCGVHGFLWTEGSQWCNGVSQFEAEVLALASVGRTEPAPEAGDVGTPIQFDDDDPPSPPEARHAEAEANVTCGSCTHRASSHQNDGCARHLCVCIGFRPSSVAPPAAPQAEGARYMTDHGFTPSVGNPFASPDDCKVMLARYVCPYTREQHDPALPPVDIDVFGYRRPAPAPQVEGGEEA